VGAVVARSLSSYYSLPLIPTNHAIGHIELGKQLTGLIHPLVLIVSGGHTALAASRDGLWKIFGETLDLTIGQLLDQLGRYLGFGSPAGKVIEELASHNDGEVQLSELPYTIKGNDVSYSGLFSSATRLLDEKKWSKEQICFAIQEIAFSILTEATERALAFTQENQLLVTGGVAANQRLRSMLGLMCMDRQVTLGVIPREFAGDCGAQIVAAAFDLYERGRICKPEAAFIRQSWRIDDKTLAF
jgi:N6-L-threonylcarbamoyladenine synthase